MGFLGISSNFAIFDGSSGQSSIYTSASYCVGDMGQMSLSLHTKAAVASLHTIWATNEDGFQTSLTTWSAVTTLVGQGAYAIEPGMRWLRVTRSSLDSLAQVFFTGRS